MSTVLPPEWRSRSTASFRRRTSASRPTRRGGTGSAETAATQSATNPLFGSRRGDTEETAFVDVTDSVQLSRGWLDVDRTIRTGSAFEGFGCAEQVAQADFLPLGVGRVEEPSGGRPESLLRPAGPNQVEFHLDLRLELVRETA